jgi:hypothetical protein
METQLAQSEKTPITLGLVAQYGSLVVAVAAIVIAVVIK